MKTVIITGSTRGIGYGLAEAFLSLGCAVVVNGRTSQAVEEAVIAFTAKYPAERVLGVPGDVADLAQVQKLWEAAKARFGQVDIWINNAGLAHPQIKFWELSGERIRAVVETNILGTIYGSKVALQGMLAQGCGAIYNMEGFGATGGHMDGLTIYGSTKASLNYLNRSWVAETCGTPVIVGAIWPGMVLTSMVTDQFEGRPEAWERFRPIFDIIAEKVEIVAPWLARRILDNQKSGVWIKYHKPGVMFRFLFLPFRKRKS